MSQLTPCDNEQLYYVVICFRDMIPETRALPVVVIASSSHGAWQLQFKYPTDAPLLNSNTRTKLHLPSEADGHERSLVPWFPLPNTILSVSLRVKGGKRTHEKLNIHQIVLFCVNVSPQWQWPGWTVVWCRQLIETHSRVSTGVQVSDPRHWHWSGPVDTVVTLPSTWSLVSCQLWWKRGDVVRSLSHSCSRTFETVLAPRR